MRRFIAGILMIVSIILLTISIYFLMGMFIQERQDNQLQQELQELMQEKEDEPGENSSGDSFIEVDAGILALHEENPDCIGWLTIEGTKIDYPVMYRPGDKNYYLHRDFNGDYSANGCLFLAEECVSGDSDNLIIYGHHMNSGKMFADLEKYKDKGFYEEHPTILFRTIWGNEQYQILSAFTTPVYTGNDFNYYSFIKAQKGADYEYFIREIKRKAIYETGITAEYGDKLLTLSTCEYSQRNGRMVVVAKKFSKMKAEKEPEEFEFGCEDLTKDWFDEISDMEEPEEKIKCDENDFFDNEQDSVEPDSKPDKARTGGIWDWDSEDYWAYGESERSLLEMAHKDMLCIAGLLEVMDSLALLADTQGRELQSGLSDVSVKLKDKAIAIENRWNTFLNKNYEIRR